MIENDKGAQDRFTERVKASLQKAEEIVTGQKRNNQRLMITSIISSAAATLAAGITAAVGTAAEIGVNGWRAACIAAAVFGFIATVSTGISQQLKTEERIVEGRQCVGRLRNLEIVITTRSKSWEEIGKEYEEIVKTYPELV